MLFISILLSVLLLVGTLYVSQGDSVLSKITDANSQTTRISVVVMKDSSYQSLSDLKNETIVNNMSIFWHFIPLFSNL